MRVQSLIAVVLVTSMAASSTPVAAEPVAVRYAEGLVHGFLTLSTLDVR